MFPDYDREALDSLLRANSNPAILFKFLDNLMDQTIEYILGMNSQSAQPTDSSSIQKQEQQHPESSLLDMDSEPYYAPSDDILAVTDKQGDAFDL